MIAAGRARRARASPAAACSRRTWGSTQIARVCRPNPSRDAPGRGRAGFRAGDPLAHRACSLEGVDERLDLPGLVRLQRSLDDEPGVAAVDRPRDARGPRDPRPGSRRRSRAPRASCSFSTRTRWAGLRSTRWKRCANVCRRSSRRQAWTTHNVRLAGDTALAGGNRRDDQGRPGPDRDRRVPRQLPAAGALPARDRGAALSRARRRRLPLAASLGLTTLVLPGLPRPRRARPTSCRLRSRCSCCRWARTTTSSSSAGSGARRKSCLCARRSRAAAPRASRAIGVAGLALALSFAALALIDLRQFREFAFAMSRRGATRRVRDPRAPDPRAHLALRRPELVAAETASPAARPRGGLRNEERALSGARCLRNEERALSGARCLRNEERALSGALLDQRIRQAGCAFVRSSG